MNGFYGLTLGVSLGIATSGIAPVLATLTFVLAAYGLYMGNM
jgi:hypothetical protein